MSETLRVLALSTLFPNAAAPNFGIFVERQLAALAARDGVEITVINPIGLPPPPLRFARRYRSLAKLELHETWRGLNVHRPRFLLLPRFGARTNPRAIARAVLPLAKQLHRKTPFDIVTADFCFPDGPAAMRIAAALGLPFTMKARGADIHHWGSVPAARRQLLAAAGQATALLAVSAALQDDMIALGIAADKINVHYTGCDQARFAPGDRSAAKATLCITGPLAVSVGAMIPRKRHALAIRAVATLPGVTLAIAGTGPDEAVLRALATELGVANRVQWLGAVPHDALPDLYRAADVMVLVSESEGLANAWVESLACGTPIVISDAGGARELLSDPAAGCIVEPQVAAVAAAISGMLAVPRVADAVRATVADFTWDRNAAQLDAVLREAIRASAVAAPR